jgi:hypothetical protein
MQPGGQRASESFQPKHKPQASHALSNLDDCAATAAGDLRTGFPGLTWPCRSSMLLMLWPAALEGREPDRLLAPVAGAAVAVLALPAVLRGVGACCAVLSCKHRQQQQRFVSSECIRNLVQHAHSILPACSEHGCCCCCSKPARSCPPCAPGASAVPARCPVPPPCQSGPTQSPASPC